MGRALVVMWVLAMEAAILFAVHGYRMRSARLLLPLSGSSPNPIGVPIPPPPSVSGAELVPSPTCLKWVDPPGPTWASGDLTGSGPPVAYYAPVTLKPSEPPLAMMGGQPCAEVPLYEAGEVVSSYPGGSCKPCVRGCLAVGTDHLPAADPNDRHAWISRMQLCIMAECRP